MQTARSFIMCLQVSRCISSSSVVSSINREGKFMKKLISGGRKSKKKWYDTSTDFHDTSFSLINKGPSMRTKRRMIVRDKLFMEHITGILSMGQLSNILSEDIEVTNVKITQDFKCVNVFYVLSRNEVSLNSEILQKCAGLIRHELSQLHVIGIVPPIQFVPDKNYFIQEKVEKQLAMLDLENSKTLSSEQLQIDTLDNNTVKTLNKESNADDNPEKFHLQLPIMKHDVLGLDHHKIMSQITSAMIKAKKTAQKRALNTNTENDVDKSPDDSNSKKPAEFLTRKEQQKIFSDFLRKRRTEIKRKYKLRQKSLNDFEEVDNEEINYEDNIEDNVDNDIDNYINEFEEEIKKELRDN